MTPPVPTPPPADNVLPRERFAWLFAVMLVAAAGNTAMQSLMPAIGRALGIPDIWMAVAFSLSAVIWVATAPYWARRADQRGRRALMRVGLIGFTASMLVCGAVLAVGLAGLASPLVVFIVFMLGRAIYGGWGSASPPAVQAYIAARTDGPRRTAALATIASSFGLGTVIGPAVAPLFIVAPLGLSGPLIVFSLVGLVVLAGIALRLPNDTPKHAARGRITAYPSLSGYQDEAQADEDVPAKLRWRDPRIEGWHLIGIVGGHGQAALLGVIGFLVIDRLGLPVAEAQHSIAIVLIAGAAATLFAQWWLIPQLSLSPKQLVAWGCAIAAAGTLVIGFADGLYPMTLAFALASIGFGFFRPGFTSGASLAVGPHEQNEVAGMVTSVNGIAYVAAPALGVAAYQFWMPLPFVAVTAILLALTLWVALRFSPSAHAG